jgi:electron transfer flavoprotein alpha subunit
MSFVWTIAEHHRGRLRDVSLELLARGRPLADALGTRLAAVVLGAGVTPDDTRRLIEYGADEVYVVDDPRLADFQCETQSAVLTYLIRTWQPQIVLAAATTSGRTLMPHVAIRANTGLTADCTELSIDEKTGNLLQTRPAIGGNIMATIRTPNHRPQMATVRPHSTRPFAPDPDRTGRVTAVALPPGTEDQLFDDRVEVLGYRREEQAFVNLEEAEVVVTGGRGLKRADGFALLRELADRLGGVLGASREAVDRGWIGYPHQVGLSGKTISPRVYIGAGASGSIQHLAGIKTSESIISINSDSEAPLHHVADLAVVGDLYAVIPAVIAEIDRRGRAGAEGR